MNAKEFFEELTKFAPKGTSIIFPATIGMLAFILICGLGHLYNGRQLKKRYTDENPYKEPEMMARYTMLMVFAIFAALSITDITYSIIDYEKNKIWYTWKFKWFPNMLA
tara:strand:- start:139 stop:465 length:327 start_codon:yes stop_codon:yes gene_type:complete